MSARPSKAQYDVVIVGGGHNGLTAAAYLARAGRSVLVLERLAHLGGAAVSEQPFAGVDARLSRYAYLVSLLPAQIVAELGLDITLRRRRISSYTPVPGGPERGLLIDHADAARDAGGDDGGDRRPDGLRRVDRVLRADRRRGLAPLPDGPRAAPLARGDAPRRR